MARTAFGDIIYKALSPRPEQETLYKKIKRSLRQFRQMTTSSRIGTQWDSVKGYRFGAVFHTITDQVWSPQMTDRRQEYGLILFGWRIGVSRSRCIFTDGKDPKIAPNKHW